MAGGGYRSAQNYFDAAVTYQKKILRPLLRKAVRPFTRAVLRGIPGARLKARFPVDCLAPLVLPTRGKAWNPWTTAHATDALLLAVWFMLREIEWAALRRLAACVPLHKTATGGEAELTRRFASYSVPAGRHWRRSARTMRRSDT